MNRSIFLSILALFSLQVDSALASVPGLVDSFDDGTTSSWASGGPNPNGPTVVEDAGPNGDGDFALRISATGASGAGSRLIAFNRNQWAGDYLAGGVDQVAMDLKNLTSVDLHVRFAVRGPLGWFSTDPVVVPPDADFATYSLSLDPEDLTFLGIGTPPDPRDTLSAVSRVRILHSTTPDFRGEKVEGSLLVDNVSAIASNCAPFSLPDDSREILLLPVFEVDTSAPNARTTLFAVHNLSDASLELDLTYLDANSCIQAEDARTLNEKATLALNVRGVEGLAADDDGIARGWLLVSAPAGAEKQITGDAFYLDDQGNFAAGDRLLRREDLCLNFQLRLLDFGSGLNIYLFLEEPQGDDPETDPPSATLRVVDQSGTPTDPVEIFTSAQSVVLTQADLPSVSFGSLRLELTSGLGAVGVEYSAFGRFSVSLQAHCLDP